MTETAKTAVVVGVGPGLGAALARRFAREGYAVALMARGMDKLTPVQDDILASGGKAASFICDASDAASVAQAFAGARSELGEIEVLIYNAGAFHFGGLMDLSPDQFHNAWKVNCMGAFLCAQQVLPHMTEAGKGSILLSSATAALRGSANFSCLAVGKFGLRALAQSMAREFGPQGVHVAQVVIDGLIDTERIRGMFPDAEVKLDPEAIADSYWHLHQQHPSAWTLELDIRPNREKF